MLHKQISQIEKPIGQTFLIGKLVRGKRGHTFLSSCNVYFAWFG